MSSIRAQILAYDYRFSPVISTERRFFWYHYLYEFLYSDSPGCFRVIFTQALFKIESFNGFEQFFVKTKNNVLFSNKLFRREDVLYIFFVFLSFLTLSKKQYKPQFIRFDSTEDQVETSIKKIASPTFIPSSWVKVVLKLFFKPVQIQKIILPVTSKDEKIKGWIMGTSFCSKRFRGNSSYLIVRSHTINIHFFYHSGGHFIFTLPRNEETLVDVFVLMKILGSDNFTNFFSRKPKIYRTFSVPLFVSLLR